MENDNEAHSAPVKIEALDESQAAPPSPQLAVHFLVPESGCANLDLPPSPPPLPFVSESMEMGSPGFQITDKPLNKKPQNMNWKPGQSIKACKIEVETVPLVSGTAEIDTEGEEQMEAQQMDGNYREDEVSDRSPAEMAPQGSLPRNLETQAPSQGQRGTITRDTPSGGSHSNLY
ncbi:uncharacterized protein LOC144547943 [Carex rostrata]